ncbi:MAG: cysteine rich repeat-containing protein [Gammaproteobacteria bacterium]|nr:cysteine rich repeat-containing protein [Gammaproteobacteria bacterium]MDH4253495.1 cysteine rich repeat-containing protein [Gammaproteobacteria bacterium]
MKLRQTVPVLVALVLAAPVGMAQDSLVDHVIKACEADLGRYCSQVTPGEGRILHCMAAHEDKISGRCQYAFYEAASLLEQMTVAIAYFASSCETEIDTLCADVEAGEGRILACLEENDAEVGDTCRQAISDLVE